MSTVTFSHSQVSGGKPLVIDTGIDMIAWAYGLNTASFPTYAGEVVQILSAYVDDLTMQGTLRNYSKMEEVYGFFAAYFQIATQGDGGPVSGVNSYNQEPMIFQYGERGWTFKVQPKQAPGFRYGRDVIAPGWRVVCHIVDDENDVEELKQLTVSQVTNNESFAITGDIGFIVDNPFSGPFTKKGNKFVPSDAKSDLSKYGDYYHNLIPSYMQHDFSSLTSGVGSRPAFGQRAGSSSALQGVGGGGGAIQPGTTGG